MINKSDWRKKHTKLPRELSHLSQFNYSTHSKNKVFTINVSSIVNYFIVLHWNFVSLFIKEVCLVVHWWSKWIFLSLLIFLYFLLFTFPSIDEKMLWPLLLSFYEKNVSCFYQCDMWSLIWLIYYDLSYSSDLI